jgi:hypothetical protein
MNSHTNSRLLPEDSDEQSSTTNPPRIETPIPTSPANPPLQHFSHDTSPARQRRRRQDASVTPYQLPITFAHEVWDEADESLEDFINAVLVDGLSRDSEQPDLLGVFTVFWEERP